MAKTIKRHDEYEHIRAERNKRKSLRKKVKERKAEKRERGKVCKTRYEIGTCGRKRRYPSMAAAECSAEYVTYFHEGRRLYSYHCEICGGWHLTSHPRGDAMPTSRFSTRHDSAAGQPQ